MHDVGRSLSQKTMGGRECTEGRSFKLNTQFVYGMKLTTDWLKTISGKIKASDS